MGAPNASKIHRVQGRLCVDPEDVTDPTSGTFLGTVHSVALVPVTRGFLVTAEEYGLETVEEIYQGRDWVCAALIRQYDGDAISTLFPGSAVGGTGDRVISEPGGLVAGERLSSRAVLLRFTPDDDNKPGFALYRALPQLDETARFNFSLVRELGFLVVFRGIRPASGVTLKIGRLADL